MQKFLTPFNRSLEIKNRSTMTTIFSMAVVFGLATGALAEGFTNSVCLEMVQIKAGSFDMGRNF
jgi:formylglycine-generating enzyme required for sulfatase activity